MNGFDMRAAIARKRDGAPLAEDQWHAIVARYMGGDVGDEQLAALFMACYFRGLDATESRALTEAMVASGETLAAPVPRCVDKHSSGGVADTASLIVVPLVAACGLPVAKLSGRALGHTGGTLDKLEAVPGVRTDLSPEAFSEQVRSVGCAIAAQSARLVPADKRMYALRDRTSTVASLGLVAASIVSKKIAAGAPAIVFDVKTGNGAFFDDAAEAERLARLMLEIVRGFGRRGAALVTDMDQPLGPAIGTGLEAIEARDFLRNERRDARLDGLCGALARRMLAAAGPAGDATPLLARAVTSGEGYEVFERMLRAQGAEAGALARMAPHPASAAILAPRSGYVARIDARALGLAARALTEAHGPGAGIRLERRVGDRVERGEPLGHVYGARETGTAGAAFSIDPAAPAPRPLVFRELET